MFCKAKNIAQTLSCKAAKGARAGAKNCNGIDVYLQK
jgi:hypothetical protein